MLTIFLDEVLSCWFLGRGDLGFDKLTTQTQTHGIHHPLGVKCGDQTITIIWTEGS